MNNSSSGPSISPETISSSKLTKIQNKDKNKHSMMFHDVITINEKQNNNTKF